MRVVIDARTATDHFPGIGRYVANLCRALAPSAASGDLDLVLLSDPSAPATRQALPDLPNVPCPVSPFALSQQWRVPSQLRRLRASVYHSPYYLMPYLSRLPSIVTCYDVIPLLYPADYKPVQRIAFRVAHLLALRAARKVLAISQSTSADLVRWFGVDPAHITVTPLAADPAFRPRASEDVAAIRRKFDLPHDYLLYFGSNKPHKNLPLLIAAWAAAIKEHRERTPGPGNKSGESGVVDPVLVIAGHWDERFPGPRQAAEAHGLGQAVRFLGPVPEPDVPALYGGAMCFVFPSRYEGFGLPVLEAMACGTPVICSNISSLPEVAGDAALMLDPSDVGALARALGRVLNDPVLRAGMSQRGLARASKFSWDRTAQETLSVYQSVCAETHTPHPAQ